MDGAATFCSAISRFDLKFSRIADSLSSDAEVMSKNKVEVSEISKDCRVLSSGKRISKPSRIRSTRIWLIGWESSEDRRDLTSWIEFSGDTSRVCFREWFVLSITLKVSSMVLELWKWILVWKWKVEKERGVGGLVGFDEKG